MILCLSYYELIERSEAFLDFQLVYAGIYMYMLVYVYDSIRQIFLTNSSFAAAFSCILIFHCKTVIFSNGLTVYLRVVLTTLFEKKIFFEWLITLNKQNESY